MTSDTHAKHRTESASERRIREAAETLCLAIERRMDELIHLVDEETALVREGKVFALKLLEPRKKVAAREFIAGLESVKKIREALERRAPEAMHHLRQRHAEFRSMLQISLGALAAAKGASEDMLEQLAGHNTVQRDHHPHAA
ncbi:MAG: hypothetical protein AB7O56_10480 [Bauldia sp.]